MPTAARASETSRSRSVRRLAGPVAALFLGALPALAQAPAQPAAKPEAPIVLELKGGEKADEVDRMVQALRRDGRAVVVRFAETGGQAAPGPAAVPAPAIDGDAANMAVTPAGDPSAGS
jgi:hypothetical protein